MGIRRVVYQRLPRALRTPAARLLGVPTTTRFSVLIDRRIVRLKHPGFSSLLRDLYLNGLSYSTWEPETRALVIQLLSRPAPVFFDIGAHVGIYSYLAVCTNPAAQVYAFEPVPKNAAYIADIIRENQLSGITLECLALSNRTGQAQLFVPRSGSVYADTGSLMNRFEGSDGIFQHEQADVLTVQAMTLDEYVSRVKLDRLDLVKVDVEEAELQVIEGAAWCLKTFRPDVICELLINTPTKQQLFDFLTRHGYQGYLITPGGLVREDRPLTLPRHNDPNRTQWREHYFTQQDEQAVQQLSMQCFGRYLG